MKLLRSYYSLLEAGHLRSAGTRSEHLVRAFWCEPGQVMVPEEQFAAAERIIAEHPTHFVGITDDIPRFGCGRIAEAAQSFLVPQD